MPTSQKITTFLWFDNNAEEAMNLYTSVFKNSKILSLTRCGENGPGPAGSVLVGSFEIEGQEFSALNGGPMFKFTEAISLVVHCDSQEEVDSLWSQLTADGGAPSRCGWLKDRFGLSWQIVPRVMVQLLQDPDPAKAGRVMKAMMQMTKIDIATLQRAHDGR
jgi:predicted 3-demethylubiquinone-9 3-methyltransferase (glyoxalase superfamily)